MSKYHYQITVNGSAPHYYYDYQTMSTAWKNVAENSENRSITAKLERRLITTYRPGTEELFPGTRLDDLYVSHWEVFAEIESR